MMKRSTVIFCLSGCVLFAACSTTAEPVIVAGPDSLSSNITAPITLAEAKSEACPAALLEAGANAKDCRCIETRLYDLGQIPGALSPNGDAPKAIFGDDGGRRKIAIALLRHDAIEQCGLFDPGHIVAQNL